MLHHKTQSPHAPEIHCDGVKTAQKLCSIDNQILVQFLPDWPALSLVAGPKHLEACHSQFFGMPCVSH
jgi:hypothetical protein